MICNTFSCGMTLTDTRAEMEAMLTLRLRLLQKPAEPLNPEHVAVNLRVDGL